ncbi:MAG: hypothetical protein GY780_09745 [bacterium]|nr:hypothetical protein [bacterium]
MNLSLAFVTLCAGAQTAPNRQGAGRNRRLTKRQVYEESMLSKKCPICSNAASLREDVSLNHWNFECVSYGAKLKSGHRWRLLAAVVGSLFISSSVILSMSSEILFVWFSMVPALVGFIS